MDVMAASSMNSNAALSNANKTLPLRSDDDVVRLRTEVRHRAIEIGLSLVEQTKVVTAASELARNTLRYGGAGEALIEVIQHGAKRGLCMTFIDKGPGIPDVALALTDGYTTGGGLGLGLGGAKRLMDEFDLKTEVGVGTTVVIKKWKRF
ncbi:MAG TPA: anti-sigma regulatory factor [Spongiibacteraceae bacterium]|jgi:serine/threonine-protein kinase RsbT